MASALSWLDAAFGVQRRSAPYLDDRGPWIMLLIGAVVALGLAIIDAAPACRSHASRRGAGLGWRVIWPCLAVPAVTPPVVLRFVPTHFLPILVGDYLRSILRFMGSSSCFAYGGERRIAPGEADDVVGGICRCGAGLYGLRRHWAGLGD